MMQGDAYGIPITITMETDTGRKVLTDVDVTDVEVVIGNLKKSLASGDIMYNSEKKWFIFPITQQESFKFRSEVQPTQVRVKLKSDDVIGCDVDDIDVTKSYSREVL